MGALLIHLLPCDKGRSHPFGFGDEAPSLAWEVIGILWRLGGNSLRIKQYHIGDLAYCQRATLGNTKQRRRHCGEFVDCLFEAQYLALAYPDIKERRGITCITEKIYMRSTV